MYKKKKTKMEKQKNYDNFPIVENKIGQKLDIFKKLLCTHFSIIYTISILIKIFFTNLFIYTYFMKLIIYRYCTVLHSELCRKQKYLSLHFNSKYPPTVSYPTGEVLPYHTN